MIELNKFIVNYIKSNISKQRIRDNKNKLNTKFITRTLYCGEVINNIDELKPTIKRDLMESIGFIPDEIDIWINKQL